MILMAVVDDLVDDVETFVKFINDFFDGFQKGRFFCFIVLNIELCCKFDDASLLQ